MTALCLALALSAALGKAAPLLVLDLEAGAAVPKDLAPALSVAELADVRELVGTRAIGAADVRSLLGLQRQRALLGCQQDASCYAEIGEALGAKEIVTGTLRVVGDRYLLVLRRTDVTRAVVLQEGSRTRLRRDEQGLLADVADLVGTLFAPVPARVVAEAPSAAGASQEVPAVCRSQVKWPSALAQCEKFSAACDGGDGKSCGFLAGWIRHEAPAEAAGAYHRGCLLRDGHACFYLGDLYLDGAPGVAPDGVQAELYLQRGCDRAADPGADRDLLQSCDTLGILLVRGHGDVHPVSRDSTRGLALLRSACDRDWAYACNDLAAALDDGLGGPGHSAERAKAVARARELLRRACDEGSQGDCAQLQVLELNEKARVQRIQTYRQGCSAGAASFCALLKNM
ncbi:MAG: tetratricopeptide repeat protein [Myxococcales bacterium]